MWLRILENDREAKTVEALERMPKIAKNLKKSVS